MDMTAGDGLHRLQIAALPVVDMTTGHLRHGRRIGAALSMEGVPRLVRLLTVQVAGYLFRPRHMTAKLIMQMAAGAAICGFPEAAVPVMDMPAGQLLPLLRIAAKGIMDRVMLTKALRRRVQAPDKMLQIG
jgi:hypothetical protein